MRDPTLIQLIDDVVDFCEEHMTWNMDFWLCKFLDHFLEHIQKRHTENRIHAVYTVTTTFEDYFIKMLSRLLSSFKTQYSVTDPGFLQGGGANPPGGDANIGFCQFFPKATWNWKNLDGGKHPRTPLRSATDIFTSQGEKSQQAPLLVTTWYWRLDDVYSWLWR